MRDYGALLTAPNLRDAGFEHGFTTRRSEVVVDGFARARQVHGREVWEHDGQAPGYRDEVEADAVFSGREVAPVAVVTADCLPLLIADPERGQVAAVHAGWRGLLAGVIEAALLRFEDPARVRVATGPAIEPCCFEVGPEVAEQYRARFGSDAFELPGPNGRPFLDLRGAAAAVLAEKGVGSGQVDHVACCTYCARDGDGEHRFFSYRRDVYGRAGARTGRIYSFIVAKAP